MTIADGPGAGCGPAWADWWAFFDAYVARQDPTAATEIRSFRMAVAAYAHSRPGRGMMAASLFGRVGGVPDRAQHPFDFEGHRRAAMDGRKALAEALGAMPRQGRPSRAQGWARAIRPTLRALAMGLADWAFPPTLPGAPAPASRLHG